MHITDTSAWTHVGGTTNCECFAIAPGVVAMVPHDGTTDTEATARENLAWQGAYWERVGQRGCVVVFMDHITEQEAGARDAYGESDPEGATLGYALIGGTFWGRAIASVFVGLKKPPVLTRFFPSLDAAMPWIQERLSADASAR